MSHLVERMLDDLYWVMSYLYWVMSYSRWKDERFWPAFRTALRREHPNLTEAGLLEVREFNARRYHYQGIDRYPPAAAGLAAVTLVLVGFHEFVVIWQAGCPADLGNAHAPLLAGPIHGGDHRDLAGFGIPDLDRVTPGR